MNDLFEQNKFLCLDVFWFSEDHNKKIWQNQKLTFVSRRSENKNIKFIKKVNVRKSRFWRARVGPFFFCSFYFVFVNEFE